MLVVIYNAYGHRGGRVPWILGVRGPSEFQTSSVLYSLLLFVTYVYVFYIFSLSLIIFDEFRYMSIGCIGFLDCVWCENVSLVNSSGAIFLDVDE